MNHRSPPNERAQSSITIDAETAMPAELWSVSHLQSLVDRRLRLLVPGAHVAPQVLHKAMSYSLLAPGKRLRPLLTLQTSFHFGRRDLLAIDCACAIEMIHAASLIIDDLPAMDDSQLRRGQPTLHRQYGEDIAILSGVALLNQAFQVVSATDGVSAETRVQLIQLLSAAVGSDGLIGGQVMDLKMRSQSVEDHQLEELNALKTSALFVAAAEAGARVAGAPETTIAGVRRFAFELGAAFQIADDLLDDPAMAGTTGKDTGKDASKPTLVSRRGSAEAARLVRLHMAQARDCIAAFGPDDGPLGALLDYSTQQFRL